MRHGGRNCRLNNFRFCVNTEPNAPSPEHIGTAMAMRNTFAPAAATSCFLRTTSTTQVPDGQVSHGPRSRMQWRPAQTVRMGWNAMRCIAAVAMVILDTFSPTAPNPPASGIASIRRRLIKSQSETVAFVLRFKGADDVVVSLLSAGPRRSECLILPHKARREQCAGCHQHGRLASRCDSVGG
jgi:hypothetical protein